MTATIGAVTVTATQQVSEGNVISPDGSVMKIRPNDWLVIFADGSLYVYPNSLYVTLFA